MYLHNLTLIFAAAKVFGFIFWSWWLVFLPSILGIGLGLIILAISAFAVYKGEL